MKKTILSLGLLFVVISIFAQAPDWQWASQAGGNSGTNAEGHGITTDNAGNSYVTGIFNGTVDFGSHTLNGNSDVFVGMMSSNGVWVWVTQTGGSSNTNANDITIDDAGNCYVTGNFNGTADFGTHSIISSGSDDIFVAKIDAYGVWQWAIQAGSSSMDQGVSIKTDNAGNCYVTGYFRDTANFGSLPITSIESIDIFVAKIDTYGVWQWATQAGGSDYDKGYGITIDDESNSYVTGFIKGTADFGTHSIISSGSNDIFVAKIDAYGVWQWAIQAGGSSFDMGYSITLDNTGISYVTGYYNGAADFGSHSVTGSGDNDIFVAKIDVNGVWQWVSQAGGSSNEEGRAIAIDDFGNNYVTGYLMGTVDFGPYSLTSFGSGDVFVAKIDSTGNWQWATQAGGIDFDTGWSITIDATGDNLVTGNFRETANFGSNILTNYGDNSTFVAKKESDFFAQFSVNHTFGYLPLEVDFTDESAGSPTTIEWDFENDGIFDSFEQNPTHIYNSIGTYSVKLKISNETQVDSLIKENYITVEYCPPAVPENVQIEISGDDAIISWTEVDTTICGSPITPDLYVIQYSETSEDEGFYYLNFVLSPLTVFTHTGVLLYGNNGEPTNHMFYKVKAIFNFSREEIEYLESLNNSDDKMKWEDVKRKLRK